ncbi:MAG: hypothetical protein M3Z16_00435 [Pseudomonadota bacterium]|nr:hypothetical protein [Pseudomonadota bacterium]
MLRRLVSSLCLLAATLCAPAAFAAEAASPAKAAASKPAAAKPAAKASSAKAAAARPAKVAILTPAQLRQCETLKNQLRATNESAVQAKKQIDIDRAAIDSSAVEIQSQQAALDRTSQEALDAYNARVGQRDQSIDAYQAKVTAYNLQVVQLGTLKDEHEKTCEARRYDDRDLADIKRGKK